jgi:hypothetical protein
MDRELARAREVVVENARKELHKLRDHAQNPLPDAELRAIADRIEWALSILQRVDLLPAEE